MNRILGDMTDEEIRQALKKKLKKWTFKTHDEYMERLNELHQQARRHLRGKIEKN